ncbi:MAG: adenosylmethionine decarboxylase [Planctomycetes bacterium]|nr:adenosylmethionine decarboxylase [Planctomycetota bacterium]
MGAESRIQMVGHHLVADLYGIERGRLSDGGLLRECLSESARRAGLTPLGDPVVHVFDGGGLTAFVVLSESHRSVHTYPEMGFAALDVFSCGSADVQAALDVFCGAFGPGWRPTSILGRGGKL